MSHADTERFEHVEACEAWMMSYDAMSVEDAMDYLNVTLNGARALKKNTRALTNVSPVAVCRKSLRCAKPA